jgi:hypothetical protein
VATKIDSTKFGSPARLVGPTESTRLQLLIDNGSIYVPHALTSPQFITLHALIHRISPHAPNPSHLAANIDATLANGNSLSPTAPRFVTSDYQLGLDELDTLARTRTGFAFADLTPELQDAMISLVSTRDLTTRKLDLSLWLDNLHAHATTSLNK